MRKIIRISLFILLLGIGLAYLIRHKQEFHLISHVSSGHVVILSALTIISCFSNGLQLKIVTDHFRLNLTFTQWFGISRVNALANLWLPFAGATPLKAMYLKKFHQMRLSSFIAAMGVAQVLINAVNSGFALIFLISSVERTNVILLSAIGTIFLGALLFLLFVPKLRLNLVFPLNYLANIAAEWREIRGDSKTIKNLILLNILNFCLQSFCIVVAFRAFSLHVSFTTAGLIEALTAISGTIHLMPGNLGVSEALILAISRSQGISINEGLHVAVLLRVVGIIWILAFAPFFTRGFLQKNKAKE